MEAFSNEVFTYVSTAIGSIMLWVFGSNVKLREGVSDFLLKKLNKTKINHIPLYKHRLFGALRQKRSAFTYFILDEPVKIEFYKQYVSITFDALEDMAKEVVKLSGDKDNIANQIFEAVDKVSETIDAEIEKKLVVPPAIEKQFGSWKAMIRASFKDSLIEILNDDLVDSNYFLAYRTLDTMINNVKVILHSGALEFSRINGAFKGLEVKDILRDANKSIGK